MLNTQIRECVRTAKAAHKLAKLMDSTGHSGDAMIFRCYRDRIMCAAKGLRDWYTKQ